MRRLSVKNFISEQERLALVEWFNKSLSEDKFLKPGLSRGEWGYEVRKTTRQQSLVDFPPIAKVIFERIKKSFSFTPNCVVEPTKQGDGIIAVATLPGGDTYAHKDPTPFSNLSVIRFNIIIQKAEKGGVLWVKDENGIDHEWDTDEAELHVYNVSDFTHAVTKVEGETPRFIMLFSMCCPKDEWENGTIKLNS